MKPNDEKTSQNDYSTNLFVTVKDKDINRTLYNSVNPNNPNNGNNQNNVNNQRKQIRKQSEMKEEKEEKHSYIQKEMNISDHIIENYEHDELEDFLSMYKSKPTQTFKIMTNKEENDSIHKALMSSLSESNVSSFSSKNASLYERSVDTTSQSSETKSRKQRSFNDHYAIMITSKYFESIDDFINLELAVKAYQGNMARFHFNPIPLTKSTRPFFESLETLYIFDKNDDKFEDDPNIFRRVVWYQVEYSQTQDGKKHIEFKNVIYTESDRRKYGLILPPTLQELDKRCFFICQELHEIEIHSCIRYVAPDCFQGCFHLTKIIIPPFWYHQGDRMFANHSGLVSFEIPKTVEMINNQRVTLTPLTSMTIPTTITRLKKYCFYSADKLKEIILHNNISEIVHNCFENCECLNSIIIPTKITALSDYCFNKAYKLKCVQMHHNIKSIGMYCFNDCLRLSSIELPTALETIGERAFSNCQFLPSITIPSNVTSIDAFAFSMCCEAKHLILSPSLRELGMHCFEKMTSITTLSIPTSIEVLPPYCFADCENLKHVFITKVHLSHLVGNKCFMNCPCEQYLRDDGMRESSMVDSTIDKEDIVERANPTFIYDDYNDKSKKKKKKGNCVIV